MQQSCFVSKTTREARTWRGVAAAPPGPPCSSPSYLLDGLVIFIARLNLAREVVVELREALREHPMRGDTACGMRRSGGVDGAWGVSLVSLRVDAHMLRLACALAPSGGGARFRATRGGARTSGRSGSWPSPPPHARAGARSPRASLEVPRCTSPARCCGSARGRAARHGARPRHSSRRRDPQGQRVHRSRMSASRSAALSPAGGRGPAPQSRPRRNASTAPPPAPGAHLKGGAGGGHVALTRHARRSATRLWRTARPSPPPSAPRTLRHAPCPTAPRPPASARPPCARPSTAATFERSHARLCAAAPPPRPRPAGQLQPVPPARRPASAPRICARARSPGPRAFDIRATPQKHPRSVNVARPASSVGRLAGWWARYERTGSATHGWWMDGEPRCRSLEER